MIACVVDERYISRYRKPKSDDSHDENKEDIEATLGLQIDFEEWMRTSVTYSWVQNASNHRSISYVQESLYHI